MAQFGPFVSLRMQQRDPRFTAAFAYVAESLQPDSAVHARIAALVAGQSERVELGDGLFAMEQVYLTKAREDAFYESHRRYIDVQVIVTGAEAMEVDDIARLSGATAYDEERDFIRYASGAHPHSRILLQAGDIALFFPADGHMPCLHPAGAPQLVRKTVVKVPVS
jgi:biofilm protein TabA